MKILNTPVELCFAYEPPNFIGLYARNILEAKYYKAYMYVNGHLIDPEELDRFLHVVCQVKPSGDFKRSYWGMTLIKAILTKPEYCIEILVNDKLEILPE